jgi:hypothetical protein
MFRTSDPHVTYELEDNYDPSENADMFVFRRDAWHDEEQGECVLTEEQLYAHDWTLERIVQAKSWNFLGVVSVIKEGITVLNESGQLCDGFSVTLYDEHDLDGTYLFTHEYDATSAHEAIFSGDVKPHEEGS